MPCARKYPARDHLDDRVGDVEEDCHAGQEHGDRKDLGRVPRRLRVEPGQRDRDDDAVEGRDVVLAEDPVETERAGEENDEESDRREAETAQTELIVHRRSIAARRKWQRRSKRFRFADSNATVNSEPPPLRAADSPRTGPEEASVARRLFLSRC